MPDTFLGERVPSGRIRRRLFIIGWLLALISLAALLVVMPVYKSRGLDNGARGLAANYLILDLGVVLFSAGGTLLGVAAWNLRYALFVLLATPVLLVATLGLPESVRDAFGPLERRSVDVVEWIVDDNGQGGVRTADAQTYRWVGASSDMPASPLAAMS